MMPGMSGWDVLREIKGSEELTDYIIKPCASESLLTKVKNVFAPLQITRRDRAVAKA